MFLVGATGEWYVRAQGWYPAPSQQYSYAFYRLPPTGSQDGDALLRPSVLVPRSSSPGNLQPPGGTPVAPGPAGYLPPTPGNAAMAYGGPNPWPPPGLAPASPAGMPPADPDTAEYLAPFFQQAAAYPDRESNVLPSGSAGAMPGGYQPWWNSEVGTQMRGDSHPLAVNLQNLVIGALRHSPDVLSVYADVEGREAGIGKAQGEFDWRAFADTGYDYTSDPVGSSLTTGGPPRYRDRDWHLKAGTRKKTDHGGELEMSQEFGRQYNNSRFFLPPDQGNTRFELTFTQPLLNKAGTAYNESQTVIAQIDADTARHGLRKQLEDHATKVAQAYWDVYRARAILWQKQRLLKSASSILDMLVARESVDAVRQQVLRAEAAVANRRSEIVRAESAVRNAESQLRLLVNDPQFTQGGRIELIPIEMPSSDYVDVSMRGSLETALCYRPDIAQAVRKIRTADVELGVAKKELLPTLDLVVSTYMAGLEGDAEIGTAFGNQFGKGEPGFSLGLLFEVPIGNRSARAEFRSRNAELRKAMLELQSTVQTGLTKVEMAVREVETSYQEMVARWQAMNAADAEGRYLDQRWRLVPGYDAGTPYLLENLLDAQERLADEEMGFVTAQVNYTLALIELKQATGTLMRCINGNGYEQGWSAPTVAVPNMAAKARAAGRY